MVKATQKMEEYTQKKNLLVKLTKKILFKINHTKPLQKAKFNFNIFKNHTKHTFLFE
jgi:hypothetical protein